MTPFTNFYQWESSGDGRMAFLQFEINKKNTQFLTFEIKIYLFDFMF